MRLTRVTECDSCGDLTGYLGGKLLGRVMDKHGSLGVTGDDNLCLGTLGQGLLNKGGPTRLLESTLISHSQLVFHHLHLLGPGAITTRNDASNISRVFNTLNSQLVVADLLGQGLEEWRASRSPDIARLRCATGKDDSVVLALAVSKSVLCRAGEASTGAANATTNGTAAAAAAATATAITAKATEATELALNWASQSEGDKSKKKSESE